MLRTGLAPGWGGNVPGQQPRLPAINSPRAQDAPRIQQRVSASCGSIRHVTSSGQHHVNPLLSPASPGRQAPLSTWLLRIHFPVKKSHPRSGWPSEGAWLTTGGQSEGRKAVPFPQQQL